VCRVTLAAVTMPRWQTIDEAYRQMGLPTLSHRTPVKASSPVALAMALKCPWLCDIVLLSDCTDSTTLLKLSSYGIRVSEGTPVFLGGRLDTWLRVIESLGRPTDNAFCRLVSKIIILLEVNGFRPVLIRYKKRQYTDGIFQISEIHNQQGETPR